MTTRSPVKVAAIFNKQRGNIKRKNSMDDTVEDDPVDSSIDQIDPKRQCIQTDGESSEVSNVMILQAINSLSNRMDKYEAKLAAMIDVRILELEKKFTERVDEVEKSAEVKLNRLDEAIDNRINQMETNLQKALRNADENSGTSNTNGTDERLDELERQARSDEIVISGVPIIENENLEEISVNICAAIGYGRKDAIKSIFRLPQRQNNNSATQSKQRMAPSIIFKFWSTDAKSDFFRKYIAKKNLCATNIGFQSAARIYVNDNLTRRNFELFRHARQLKIEGKIFHYSTLRGRVFIKLNSDSKQIGVSSLDQLNSLLISTAAH